MVASTSFILSLFICCTIAQITNITPKGAAVTKILVPSSIVRSTTVLPLTVTPKPKQLSTSTPTKTPPTVQSSTTTPQTVPPSTTTPPTVPPSTTTPSTVPPSTTTRPTVPPSTTTPPTIPPSTTAPPTVPPWTIAPPTVPPSTTTPPTIPPSTTTPPTIPPSTTAPPTVPPSTTAPPTVPSSTTTPPTVPPSTTTPPTVEQSTTTPPTVPQSTSKSITVPATGTLVLEFKCAPNGFITDISGVDKGEVVLLNGSNYCHLTEASCDWKNKKKLNVLHVKGENTSNIAGGKNAHFYQLECKTAGAFVASANTSMNIAIPAPTDFNQEIKKPTEPTNTIKLVITDKKGTPATKVHIGDPLLLKITGPAGYTIEPISCAASSSLDKDYVLWTNDSCSSKDTAVIENAWNRNKTIPNIVLISMYGFRFVKSNTVVVTCSALFCPKGMQCSLKPCVNVKSAISRRRKRNAGVESGDGYLQESMSTSFTVVDNRIDTSGCSGTFVSVFTYVTACALLLAIK